MFVKSLTFENVRRFEKLKLDLERPGNQYAGWTVFVGGNSSGKSTILRAIALALVGPEIGARLMGKSEGWVRNGQDKASVELELIWDKNLDKFKPNGAPPTEKLELGVRWLIEKSERTTTQFRAVERKNGAGIKPGTLDQGPWSQSTMGWFSAGYGPMRRLNGSSSEALRLSLSKDVDSRFMTLFREDAALSESEEWLKRMHARQLESRSREISVILQGVRNLLGDGLLPAGMHVSRITVDEVFLIDYQGLELPMRDISDGCRSIYATILDLVHGLYEVFGVDGLFVTNGDGKVVVDRPGVVIIDEIEAHLHPSWQREMPEWLKQHFPKIQFLVSTHSPLIAQAADPNGLFILPGEGDFHETPRPATPTEYEKIRWGTAHKTVLGVAFGMTETRTNWAVQQLNRWQELNAKKRSGATLTKDEKASFKELKEKLDMVMEESGVEVQAG